jgi:hypothetical protein
MLSINPDAHSGPRARPHALGRRDGAEGRRVWADAVVDGELVAIGKDGVSHFQLLQNALRREPSFCTASELEPFSYYDKDGKRITDAAVIRRIKSIGIPPAYESVWICPSSNGHI